MTNNSQVVDQLRSDGFVIIKDFISESICERLESSLESMLEQDNRIASRDERDFYMVHNPMLRNPDFYDVFRKSILTDILTEMLGQSFILYAYTTSSMPVSGSNWSRRIHVDCPRLIPNYLTNMNVFIPLSRISEYNGGIELLPKSQWDESTPSEKTFETERIVPEIDAGGLLIFYSRLWHSGGFNNSQNARHAITLNFCRSYMRQRFDYPRMISAEHLQDLDPTQRQILGFNVRVPTSLEEYYLPESQRLYKANQG